MKKVMIVIITIISLLFNVSNVQARVLAEDATYLPLCAVDKDSFISVPITYSLPVQNNLGIDISGQDEEGSYVTIMPNIPNGCSVQEYESSYFSSVVIKRGDLIGYIKDTIAEVSFNTFDFTVNLDVTKEVIPLVCDKSITPVMVNDNINSYEGYRYINIGTSNLNVTFEETCKEIYSINNLEGYSFNISSECDNNGTVIIEQAECDKNDNTKQDKQKEKGFFDFINELNTTYAVILGVIIGLFIVLLISLIIRTNRRSNHTNKE